MSYNTAKCGILRITITHNYKMQNDYLNSVKHHPYHGIEILHNLRWTVHISKITLNPHPAKVFFTTYLTKEVTMTPSGNLLSSTPHS